jgi:alcohol dehydrogenase
LTIFIRGVSPAARVGSIGGRQASDRSRSLSAAKYLTDRSIATQSQSVQLLSAGKDPLTVSAGHLVVGERSVLGSITGTPYESEKTLDFSVLTGVRPQIETMPLEKALEAYQKMRSGDVKFWMVLTMKAPRNAYQ